MDVRHSALRVMLLAAGVACVVVAGCRKEETEPPADPAPNQGAAAAPADPVPNVVTAEIQAGIEKHIEERTREGDGYFRFSAGDRELALRLVRVHTEYLANLGPGRHFACVDLVDTEGDVYQPVEEGVY